MIKSDKKSAFSLAESLISMMLLFLVVMLTLSTITRKKTNYSAKSTVSGMYACWFDSESNKLTPEYYNGNVRIDDPNPLSEDRKCEFQMDRRVKKYFIVAVGARKNQVDGQLVQKEIDTPSGENEDEMYLNIELGSSLNGGMTKVTKRNGEDVISTLETPKVNNSGLVSGNIKSCKYIRVVSGPDYNRGDNPKCKISKYCPDSLFITTGNEEADCNSYENSCAFILDKQSGAGMLKKDEQAGYTGTCSNDDGRKVKIKVIEEDSSFKAEETEQIKNSKFVRYLKMIPPNIQNGLTDTLLDYYQKDNGNKKGVVLILW